MNINALSLNTNILSLGSILGTSGSQTLMDGINARCGGGSFFGVAGVDPFREGFSNFIQQVIAPIREVQQTLTATAKRIFQKDEIRPITSVEELKKGIPPCMMMPIIYHEPVRRLLEEERIDGFGIDPKSLQDEDPYESIINSGVVELHSSLLDKNGEVEIGWTFKNTDPELTFEEQEALYETRKFIEQFLKDDATRNYDPTDYPSLKG